MSAGDVPEEVAPAALALLRFRLAELDYLREVRRLLDAGRSEEQLARELRVFKPQDLALLRAAREVSMPLEGFSSALPMEICERYAAGLLDRDRLVDELARYPYVPLDKTDGWDDLVVNPPGTWAEFMLAIDIGLVEDALYEEVFNRKHDVAS
ncbi:hypothetical protein [Clavibacter michiganensis]|uniref:Uncharacterized protein n=1 Tax=Clavibacter michiganensis subsp. insidiosus TaxID=33014 RepID=A0A0D5CLE2_9MICO|nr:hypothetical protein [Clavibacter michiganensis]AJW80075.1 hypothetical protein VO01_13935 [Clavibacter michiganensis subsp. insidiosus]AWF97274.1 hypothetical protein BEH61_02015 [Clavibacter michiganensis subsp. insidiosus]AWG02638.1 hypothetical protein BEH62_13645 [Clavibacter michiganensis subsp. insidiosus]OQJ58931.1 hypothetical protein B5P21_02735 [Clavibacter michiganensis subsp. insidiosus]RII85558.1 hypothetical protein DZF92_13780 [Clavibacter michiganensis subsp. insidiosus]